MLKLLFGFATLFASLGSLRLQTGPQSSSHAREIDKPIPLFNGKNLDGWYTFIKGRGRDKDPKNVFVVKDGIIHISGEEWGCITTNNEYENFSLLVEFKWGGKTFEPRLTNARDGGILVHSKGMDGGYSGTWMHGIECQIIEGGTGDMLVVGDGSNDFAITCPVANEKQKSSYLFKENGKPVTIHTGRINWWGRAADWEDVINFRGKQDVEKPVGEWNKMECVAEGNNISIFLNGVLVNRAMNVLPAKGRIQIQSEGAAILFRRIELTMLPNKSGVKKQ